MLGKFLRPFYGKKKFYPLWQKLFAHSLIGMNIGGGAGVEVSGENNVLLYVKEHMNVERPLIVFDVGANKGQYTKNLLRFFQGNQINVHCFEPGHETFRILAENLGGGGNTKQLRPE